MNSSSSPLRLLLTMLVLVGSLGLAACEEEGPAEKLGEEIDNTVEEAGDAVEKATE